MKYINEGFPEERIINYRRSKIQIQKDNTYVTDIGFFPITELHKVDRAAGIEENIICFCTKGKGYVQIEGAVREVNANEYFIIPKQKSHRYFSGIIDGWGLYFIHLSGNKADRFCQAHKRFGNELSQAQLNIVYNVLYNCIKTLEKSPSSDNVKFVNKSVDYLLDSLLNFELNKNMHNAHDELVYSFVNYLETNISYKVSLNDLLQELNVSQGTLYTVVKKKYNVTPMQYVFNLKVNLAADLLKTTNHKVSKISRMVGFDDQYHFSKKFKNITGISPTEYRNLNRDL